MASETYNQYEKEFLSLQGSLSTKLTSLSSSSSSGPDAKLTLNQISRELEEMDEIVIIFFD
jgi:hypothetical protein